MLGGAPSRRRAFVGMGCRASCCPISRSRRWCQPDCGRRRGRSHPGRRSGRSKAGLSAGWVSRVCCRINPAFRFLGWHRHRRLRLHGVGIRRQRAGKPKSPDVPPRAEQLSSNSEGRQHRRATELAPLCDVRFVGDPQVRPPGIGSGGCGGVRRAARARVNRERPRAAEAASICLLRKIVRCTSMRWTGSGGTSAI